MTFSLFNNILQGGVLLVLFMAYWLVWLEDCCEYSIRLYTLVHENTHKVTIGENR
jgi:hypothetical protein